jgi:hypothetical protein
MTFDHRSLAPCVELLAGVDDVDATTGVVADITEHAEAPSGPRRRPATRTRHVGFPVARACSPGSGSRVGMSGKRSSS